MLRHIIIQLKNLYSLYNDYNHMFYSSFIVFTAIDKISTHGIKALIYVMAIYYPY